MDCIPRVHVRFDTEAVNKDLVLATWRGFLENKGSLLEIELSVLGVLVGNQYFINKTLDDG